MELTIFHYHLRPGGIGTVISSAIEALKNAPGPMPRIRVVTGSGEGALDFQAAHGVEVDVIPEIGYAEGEPAGAESASKAAVIGDLLLERYGKGDAVWWIHNYHLGKNAAFTRAILQIAGAGGTPRIILQPHDFPEAGRYGNLSALEQDCPLPLYPDGPRIRYALVNGRDFSILRSAGISARRLFLLENPVRRVAGLSHVSADDRRRARERLLTGSAPDSVVLLYPVRAIRRKNVIEAGLLTLLLGPEARLVVTLPGISGPEAPYSLLVEDCFQSGLIPGMFAVGAAPLKMAVDEAAAASDCVVSSSVQEGFGYSFLNALQWGLPLAARSLETLEGMSDVFKDYPAFFYSAIPCPLDGGSRQRLRILYGKKLQGLAKIFPADAVDVMAREIDGMLCADSIDFSYLDPAGQADALRMAKGSGEFLDMLRQMNRAAIRGISEIVTRRPQPEDSSIDGRFGLQAYASRFRRILDSFREEGGNGMSGDGRLVQDRVRRSFAKAEFARLLYG